MAASTGDKITDTRNAARPNSARATGTRSAAGVSLACDDLSGWPTASKVHFVTYTVDSSSNPVAGTQLDCSGIVSGNSITSFTVIDGTDLGNSVGDYVEMLPTAAWGQDLADILTSTHNRSGGLKTGITLSTPVIANFSNADHTHATAAQGGQLTAAGLLSTIFSSQLLTQANAGTGGGTMSYINLGGIKLLWCNGANFTTGTASAAATFTLPVGFFSTITYAGATPINQTGTNNQYGNVASMSTTTITVTATSTPGAATTGVSILVIGT